MFENLTEKLSGVFRSLSGRGRLTEGNIRDALRDVRTALLEADVHYQVARDFVEEVREKAIGQDVLKTLRPEQVFIKVIHDEMVRLMGPVDSKIPYVSPGPTVLMLAGLQGSGKTTTAGKLARLIAEQGHRPMLVACDCHRPAAVEQLLVVGSQVDVPVYSEGLGDPVDIARNGVKEAKRENLDVAIVDTAGRLHIDRAMMQEARDIARAVMIPGMGSAMKDLPIDDRELDQTEALIHSMTPQERARPDIIDASRRRRIARGSGTDPQDVSGLVKSFGQVKEVIRQMQGAGAFGGRQAAQQAMSQIDLFSGRQKKKRTRSKRKRKSRKKRSR